MQILISSLAAAWLSSCTVWKESRWMVDVAVATDQANFAKFVLVMEKLGLKPRVPIDPRSLLDSGVMDHIIHEKQALVFSFLDPDLPAWQVAMFLRSDLSHQATAANLEVVQRSKASDFDGHTEFHRLSPRQRLSWLDEAVAFTRQPKEQHGHPTLLPCSVVAGD
jgi:alpha-beta hydrolase superfamily lysophospholipase